MKNKKGIDWYSIWQGYVIIRIQGNSLERLIDQIINKNIKLWDLKKVNSNCYTARIMAADFNKLRPLVRNRMCKVKILEKHGIPFLFKKIFSHTFILIGMILLITFLFLASSFIWTIEINGVNTIPKSQIYQKLKQQGVHPGVLKNNIDLMYLEKLLSADITDIAWVDLQWKGTKLLVRIVEKKEPELEKGQTIVAKKNGIIKELIILKGNSVVKEGDTVTKGQTLIIPFPQDNIESPKAKGIVKARVWYKSEAVVNLKQQDIILTGEKKTRIGIKINDFDFFIPPSLPYSKNYIRIEQSKELFKWRNIALSLEFIKENYYKTNKINYQFTQSTANFLAKQKALAGFLNKMDILGNIISIKTNNIDFDHQNKEIKVTLLIETIEDIACEREDFCD